MKHRLVSVAALAAICSALLLAVTEAHAASPLSAAPRAGTLITLPDDGRYPYFQAIDSATHDLRIEICVLEDPQILEHVQSAIGRGVQVRAIVDRGKYLALEPERANLAQYLTGPGGELHVSNPVFPRSFPKIILIDSRTLVFGSACLDTTTFTQYRDFAQVNTDPKVVRALGRLFESDWKASAVPDAQPAAFNPTPPITVGDLIVAPVNATPRLVALYQRARRTLDVYTEILGNQTLEAELVAAVDRGVKVRLIAPAAVNGDPPSGQQLQQSSLAALAAAGVEVHVSGPDQTAQSPYMHARATVVDGTVAYLGSVSLSPDSATMNREMGLIQRGTAAVRKLGAQFASDFTTRTRPFAG